MIEGEIGGVLEELGRELGIPGLGPDEHGTCLIRLKNGVKFQIEMLKGSDYLLIASDLGEVPPGRFRTDFFEAALNFNVSDQGGVGTLGFSKRTNHMILFDSLYIKGLNGIKVADSINSLSTKAMRWSSSLQRGEIPQLGADEALPSARGIFGLKP